MENSSSINPWFSMWLHPRMTIRHIVETNPDRHVILLAAVAGIGRVLDQASTKSSGDHVSLATILLMAVVFGPVSGIVSLYIGGLLLSWTGKWIGGRSDSRNIRSAIAWAGVISIWSMPIWIPELLLFGGEMFTSETPNIDDSSLMTILFFSFSSLDLAIGIWGMVVFLKCIGEVQGFSAWKALLNLFLSALAVIIPIAGIALTIILLIH